MRSEFDQGHGSDPGHGGSPSQDPVHGQQTHGQETDGDGSPELQSATPEAAKAFVDNITTDPKSVVGKSAEDIAGQFNDAGYHATVVQTFKKGTSGNAVQVRVEDHPEITNIQVHPGGGRHTPPGSPYWKISTNTSGKKWVIPENFRGADSLGGEAIRYDE
ncbi:hypothetical protein [Winogradskya humida]|uniref:hypothetical protein n=1 Tax=Winogradskya humida TaxID=113566 RepID=UPI001940693C|nr:hypothetical protein [Actinoplanes humidus]